MNSFISISTGAVIGVCIYFAIRPAAWRLIANKETLPQPKKILLVLFMLAVYFLAIFGLAFAVKSLPNLQKIDFQIALSICAISFMIPFGRMVYITKKQPNHPLEADD